MQTVDYYTGAQTNPGDESDQFMVSAREMYTQQQMQTPQANPYFSYGDTGYQGPGPGSHLEFYQGNTMVGQQYIPQQPMQYNSAVNGLHYSPVTTNMGYQNQNGYLGAPNQMPIQTPQSPVMQYVPQSGQLYTQMQYSAPNPQFYGYRDGGPGVVTYSNPAYNGFVGRTGNPALDYIQQRQGGYQPINYGVQQPQQGHVIHVKGADPLQNGKYLYTSNLEEQLDQLQVDMVLENQEAIAKREEQAKKLSGSYLNNNYLGGLGAYGYNLYGGIDPQVYNKYKTKVQELASEAEERRNKFNKNLSRLVHNWLGDDVTDEQIDKHFEGYTYTIPQQDIYFAQAQQRFERLVPVNTAAAFWAHDAEVTAEFRKYCPDGRNMNEFFNDATMVLIRDAEEQEAHRRRDGKLYYDQDIMHHYIRQYAKEKMIDDSGIDYTKASKGDIMKHLMGKDNLKDLEDSGITIKDDGHFDFNIRWDTAPESLKLKLRDPSPTSSLPSGSIKGPVIQNDNVIRYEQNRSKFFQSIMENSAPKINHGDGSGNLQNLSNLSPPGGMTYGTG